VLKISIFTQILPKYGTFSPNFSMFKNVKNGLKLKGAEIWCRQSPSYLRKINVSNFKTFRLLAVNSISTRVPVVRL